MQNNFNVGDIVTPVYNFSNYNKNYKYQIINKKPHKIFYTAYELYCLQTKTLSVYPSLYITTRFINLCPTQQA
jgi:hypothetical protein